MGFIDYLIEESSVVCGLQADTWDEAIRKGASPLLEKGVATEEYVEAIIRKCRENGPYIVIAPGIAMPHARPEEGALKLGYALVTLAQGVNFGEPDNDPVRLLIYMAAPSVKEHNEEAVCQIADLCDEEAVVTPMQADEDQAQPSGQ